MKENTHKLENITLALTFDQAEMLKLCLEESLDSKNNTKAKWAGIFLDAINNAQMETKNEKEDVL